MQVLIFHSLAIVFAACLTPSRNACQIAPAPGQGGHRHSNGASTGARPTSARPLTAGSSRSSVVPRVRKPAPSSYQPQYSSVHPPPPPSALAQYFLFRSTAIQCYIHRLGARYHASDELIRRASVNAAGALGAAQQPAAPGERSEPVVAALERECCGRGELCHEADGSSHGGRGLQVRDARQGTTLGQLLASRHSFLSVMAPLEGLGSYNAPSAT